MSIEEIDKKCLDETKINRCLSHFVQWMRDIINQFNCLLEGKYKAAWIFKRFWKRLHAFRHCIGILAVYSTSIASSFVRQSSRFISDEVLIADEHVAIKLLGKSWFERAASNISSVDELTHRRQYFSLKPVSHYTLKIANRTLYLNQSE